MLQIVIRKTDMKHVSSNGKLLTYALDEHG